MRSYLHKSFIFAKSGCYKKEESYTCDPSKREVEGSPGVLRREPYRERLADCTNYVNHLLLN
jgi:hypothetical protein